MSSTLVLGASLNKDRYSNLAIQKLIHNGIVVYAIGRRKGVVSGVEIEDKPFHDVPIDTVTLYINPTIQKEYYEYILALKPRRIIFNPGTENPELDLLARNKGIETLDACTLVMLNLGTY